MAATATKKKEVTISDKLDMLLKLQQIDTEIDRIRTIRGELPLEVQDLEDKVLLKCNLISYVLLKIYKNPNLTHFLFLFQLALLTPFFGRNILHCVKPILFAISALTPCL